MRPHRKRRLYFILILLIGISTAVGFALFALRQNINLYYTPAQLLQQNLHSTVRLGGLVVKGSVHHQKKSLNVTFVLTDFHRTIKVQYEDVLPSLFREGQGIVAEGHLNVKGVFVADQVLAKHDENYHPPDIANSVTLPTVAAHNQVMRFPTSRARSKRLTLPAVAAHNRAHRKACKRLTNDS